MHRSGQATLIRFYVGTWSDVTDRLALRARRGVLTSGAGWMAVLSGSPKNAPASTAPGMTVRWGDPNGYPPSSPAPSRAAAIVLLGDAPLELRSLRSCRWGVGSGMGEALISPSPLKSWQKSQVTDLFRGR